MGAVLLAWGKLHHGQEGGQIAPSTRRGANCTLSNSSNFTNYKAGSSSRQKQKPQESISSVENQSTTFKKSTKSEKKFSTEEKNHHENCRLQSMKKAGVKKYLNLGDKNEQKDETII